MSIRSTQSLGAHSLNQNFLVFSQTHRRRQDPHSQDVSRTSLVVYIARAISGKGNTGNSTLGAFRFNKTFSFFRGVGDSFFFFFLSYVYICFVLFYYISCLQHLFLDLKNNNFGESECTRVRVSCQISPFSKLDVA